jgi:hypothetical protein
MELAKLNESVDESVGFQKHFSFIDYNSSIA